MLIVFKITTTTAYQYTLSVLSTHEYYYQGQFMQSQYTTEFHAVVVTGLRNVGHRYYY